MVEEKKEKNISISKILFIILIILYLGTLIQGFIILYEFKQIVTVAGRKQTLCGLQDVFEIETIRYNAIDFLLHKLTSYNYNMDMLFMASVIVFFISFILACFDEPKDKPEKNVQNNTNGPNNIYVTLIDSGKKNKFMDVLNMLKKAFSKTWKSGIILLIIILIFSSFKSIFKQDAVTLSKNYEKMLSIVKTRIDELKQNENTIDSISSYKSFDALPDSMQTDAIRLFMEERNDSVSQELLRIYLRSQNETESNTEYRIGFMKQLSISKTISNGTNQIEYARYYIDLMLKGETNKNGGLPFNMTPETGFNLTSYFNNSVSDPFLDKLRKRYASLNKITFDKATHEMDILKDGIYYVKFDKRSGDMKELFNPLDIIKKYTSLDQMNLDAKQKQHAIYKYKKINNITSDNQAINEINSLLTPSGTSLSVEARNAKLLQIFDEHIDLPIEKVSNINIEGISYKQNNDNLIYIDSYTFFNEMAQKFLIIIWLCAGITLAVIYFMYVSKMKGQGRVIVVASIIFMIILSILFIITTNATSLV